MSTPVFFYCPSERVVAKAPREIGDYWNWVINSISDDPVILENGVRCSWDGPYSWTIQTYMHLRDAGLPCDLVSKIPSKGIVVAHSDFWLKTDRAQQGQFFVEIKPDRQLKLPAPQFVVCQSRFDPILRPGSSWSERGAAIGYWPQPSLVPRKADTNKPIQAAAFLGNPESFLQATQKLVSELAYRGVAFHFPARPHWHDYSHVDLVIAVRDPRSFSDEGRVHTKVEMKPPNKLVNAWLAGVPAILSPEPSHDAIRRSPLDFIEARNVPEILAAVDLLINEPKLYQRMVLNGHARAKEYSVQSVVGQWIKLIQERIEPLYFAAMAGAGRRPLNGQASNQPSRGKKHG